MSSAQALARRQVTLWQLLQWTYQRQEAYRLLRTIPQMVLWLATYMDWLSEDARRSPVTWDAGIVHAAVSELPEIQAGEVVVRSMFGDLPEPPEDRQPEPHPVQFDRTRGLSREEEWERIKLRDRVIDVLVRTIGTVSYERRIVEHRGKGRRKVVLGTETVVEPVRMCPLRWEPDPYMQQIARNSCESWNDSMQQLPAMIAELGLRNHELIDDSGAIIALPPESWVSGDSSGDIPESQRQREAQLIRIRSCERFTVGQDGTIYERKARAS